MTIKIIKINSGEEIIGDVRSTSEPDTLTIDQPCVIQVVPSRQDPNQPMIALLPYAVYTKHHRVSIKLKDVVWEEEPVDELYNQYSSAFGSGLVVPTL